VCEEDGTDEMKWARNSRCRSIVVLSHHFAWGSILVFLDAVRLSLALRPGLGIVSSR